MKSPRHIFLIVALFGAASVHGQSTPPQPLSTVSPVYPASLEDTGKEGQAVLTFTISAEGDVGEAVVTKADDPSFGDAALEVLPKWKFKPATKDGRPIAIKVSVPFVFEAPEKQKFNAALHRKVFMELPAPALTMPEFGGERPKITKRPKPVYPRKEIGSGQTVEVQVRFVVGPDGLTHNPETVGEVAPRFAAAAIANVAQTTYERPMKNGEPVFLALTTRIKFEDPGDPNSQVIKGGLDTGRGDHSRETNDPGAGGG